MMVTILKEGDQIEQIALSSAGENLLQVAEDAAWRTAKGLMEKPGRLVPARR